MWGYHKFVLFIFLNHKSLYIFYTFISEKAIPLKGFLNNTFLAKNAKIISLENILMGN
jgi:hypothetical protein